MGPAGLRGPSCARRPSVSPFWVEAPMFECEWATGPPPLPERLARSGARIEGLRLADGTLILKFENGSEAAQMRIRPGPDAEMGTGPVLRLGQAQALARLHDAWRPAGVPGPHPQRGPRGAPALRREPDQVQRPACAARDSPPGALARPGGGGVCHPGMGRLVQPSGPPRGHREPTADRGRSSVSSPTRAHGMGRVTQQEKSPEFPGRFTLE